MKNKKIVVLSIILVIIVIGIVVFLNLRSQPHELSPQEFAQLPEKPKIIAEFHQNTEIYSVAFSPSDRNLIASADQNGTIKLWDRNNTIDPVKILSHPGQFAHIGFSPTGELLASAGFGTLILWDVASERKLNSLETSREFAFSPDGHQLVTVRNGVKLWDIRNPKQIKEIDTLPFDEAHKIGSWARAVDISPDGKLIATGYANGNVNVWNLKTKKLVKTLETALLEMNFLKFSPNNKYMVSGGHEKDMYSSASVKGYIMWELPSWQRKGEVLRGHVENLVFSPDGKTCATANHQSYSGRGVELWSTINGAPITSIPTEARDVSFTQDGSLLVSGNEDGVIQVWQLNSQQLESATPPSDVIRIIYFLSKDKEPFPNITEKLDKSIREVQDFYADEMERHGFGRKTFKFETDENGKAKIYLVKENQINNFDLSNDIWLAVVDDISAVWQAVPKLFHTGNNGTFWYPAKEGIKDNIWHNEIVGITHGRLVYASVKYLDRQSVAYTFRDAFGLPYFPPQYEPSVLKRLFYRVNNMMPWKKKWAKLSRCEAEWLDKSRFFNPTQPFFDKRPKMEMKVSQVDTSDQRLFQFAIADEDGMHQVQLFVPIDIKNQRWRKKFHDCQALNGKEKATVAFEITYPEIKIVKLRMIDMHGNIASREFHIKEKTSEPSKEP